VSPNSWRRSGWSAPPLLFSQRVKFSFFRLLITSFTILNVIVVHLVRSIFWLSTFVKIIFGDHYMSCCGEHYKSSQSHLGRAASPPLTTENGLAAACATSCAMPTADKSNHSAVGMLHAHRSATCFLYVTLRCPIPLSSQKLSFLVGSYPPKPEKSSSDPPDPPPQKTYIGVHTLNF